MLISSWTFRSVEEGRRVKGRKEKNAGGEWGEVTQPVAARIPYAGPERWAGASNVYGLDTCQFQLRVIRASSFSFSPLELDFAERPR
jgi:hypothetical protein